MYDIAFETKKIKFKPRKKLNPNVSSAEKHSNLAPQAGNVCREMDNEI